MEDWKSPSLDEHPELVSALALLEGWIELKRAEQRLPGLSAGIVFDQDLLWSRGFGWSDEERRIPARSDMLYRIASITKLFTGIAVLQLRDGGLLRLDDPVTESLPWFQIRQRHPDAPAITLRHLLTHTSGLPRDASTPMWTEVAFPGRDEMIADLSTRETALPPGTRWKYSNLAFALLGEVVAAVSGEPYDAYIRERILAPLGMAATRVLPRNDEGRLATGYGRLDREGRREPAPFMEAGGFAPAFSLASSVEDLARFAAWQLRCEGADPVLRGSTLKEMQRLQWIEDDWRSGCGLAFGIRRIGDRVFAGHGGGAPGHTTTFQLCPAEKFAVIVLTNVVSGEPMAYAQAAIDLVLPAAAKALKRPEEPPAFDREWSDYLGRYGNRWGETLVGTRDHRLALFSLQHPDQPPGLLVPEGDGTFRMERGSNDGERVAFERDAQGQVVSIRIAGERLTRTA